LGKERLDLAQVVSESKQGGAQGGGHRLGLFRDFTFGDPTWDCRTFDWDRDVGFVEAPETGFPQNRR
jgi:hypothetical protein